MSRAKRQRKAAAARKRARRRLSIINIPLPTAGEMLAALLMAWACEVLQQERR